jgi:hypothetical protein
MCQHALHRRLSRRNNFKLARDQLLVFKGVLWPQMKLRASTTGLLSKPPTTKIKASKTREPQRLVTQIYAEGRLTNRSLRVPRHNLFQIVHHTNQSVQSLRRSTLEASAAHQKHFGYPPHASSVLRSRKTLFKARFHPAGLETEESMRVGPPVYTKRAFYQWLLF